MPLTQPQPKRCYNHTHDHTPNPSGVHHLLGPLHRVHHSHPGHGLCDRGADLLPAGRGGPQVGQSCQLLPSTHRHVLASCRYCALAYIYFSPPWRTTGAWAGWLIDLKPTQPLWLHLSSFTLLTCAAPALQVVVALLPVRGLDRLFHLWLLHLLLLRAVRDVGPHAGARVLPCMWVWVWVWVWE